MTKRVGGRNRKVRNLGRQGKWCDLKIWWKVPKENKIEESASLGREARIAS